MPNDSMRTVLVALGSGVAVALASTRGCLHIRAGMPTVSQALTGGLPGLTM